MASILGITDEQTTCDCCGRQDLKRTVVIAHNDGEIARYGVVCASKMLGRDAADIRKESKTAQDAADRVARIAREKAAREESDRWMSWLSEQTGIKGDTFRAIHALGGFTAARALYGA